MSLIAHYPLNGDTLDYSGNGRHGVNSGAILNSEGKIGQSYQFTNSTNGVNIPNENFTGMEEYTMTAWVNPAGNHRNYEGAIISSGNWNSQAWSFGLSQNNTQIDVASNWYNTYITHTIPLNTWTHIVSVMKNNVATVYVNGVEVATRAATGKLESNATNTFIGRETYAEGYFSFNGKLNDVRIYDHALSTKEIKELYKTKILHYTFDDFAEPTTNLWTGDLVIYNNYGVPATLTNTGQTYMGQPVYRLGMTVDTAKASALSSFQSSLTSHGVYGSSRLYKANTKYSASIYWKPVNKSDVLVGGTASNISGWRALPKENIGDGWFRHTQVRDGTVTIDRTDNVFHSFLCPSMQLNETVYIDFTCPQIEEGKNYSTPYVMGTRTDKVLDKSGFRNDSTLGFTTTPTWTSNSRIGEGAYEFINNPQRLDTPSINSDTLTLSAWHKWVDNTNTWRTIFGHTSNKHHLIFNNAKQLCILDGDTRHFNYAVADYEWHHYSVIFRSGTSASLYVDGVFISTISTSLDVRSYPISVIGNWGGNNYPVGILDDVRVYATALSDEDIMELYKNRMNVDDKGNLFVNGINEPYNHLNPTDFFRNVNDPASQTPMPEVVDGRNTWSVYPAWFHPNGALNNVFKENTSYDIQITFKHHTEYLGNYVGGGFQFNFTDGSSHNLITTGNSDWKTLKYITPSSKTLMNIGVYYYTSFRVYIDDSSYIREYIPTSLSDKGILNTTKVASTSLPVRYVRDYINGSNVNTGHHWVELQAIDGFGSNIAFGKTSTSPLLTDGSTATDPYYSTGLSSPDGRYVEVDLGAVHDIKEVKVWHYWHDGRTYYDTKTEVSEDGVNWITIFDSAIEGTYPETVHGHTIQCRPQSFSMRENGTIYARNVYDSY